MKALVVGCGSIGLRHIGHLRQLGLSGIEAVDPSPAARARTAREYGIQAQRDLERALDRRPDIVLVCTPAATHVAMTRKALETGAHVFIEKPIGTTLDGVASLVRRVEADGRIVQVGYQLRYHPAMRATKRLLEDGRLGPVLTARAEFGLYLPKWWPGRDYRRSYMASAEAGGGLLMDVSHEIDLMMWFLGEVDTVTGYGRKLSALAIKGVDVITVVMQMASGALVSLHMDCLQPAYTRGFRLTGEGTALRWECGAGRADRSVGRLELYDSARDRFEPVRLRGDARQTYLDELRDFLGSVETGRPPAVGVRQSLGTLKVALAIQRAISTGRSVTVDRC